MESDKSRRLRALLRVDAGAALLRAFAAARRAAARGAAAARERALWRPALAIVLGMTAGAAGARAFETATAPRPTANVIFILVDTLRADHLGCYGYHRDTSPNIDAFAQGAKLYRRNKAQSSMTAPSMASLFSSRLSAMHYVPENAPYLPALLQSHGYRTIAIQTNPWMDFRRGFTRGFDEYITLNPPDIKGNLTDWHDGPEREANVFYSDTAEVVEHTREAVERIDPERPFLLYVHFMDVHGPYVPRPEYDLFSEEKRDFCGKLDLSSDFIAAGYSGDMGTVEDLREEVVALYDGQIREVDAAVGAILEMLDRRGLLDDAVVVIASDHGEEFGEHGIVQHANGLFETLVHVPLIVRYPGQERGAEVRTLSENLDIVPTILRAVGLAPRHFAQEGFEGRALQGVSPRDAWISRSLLVKTPQEGAGGTIGYYSAKREGFKLIVESRRASGAAPPEETIMLYNLWNDPRETARIETLFPGEVEALLKLLPAYRVDPRSMAQIERPITDEERDRLKALGYLN